MSPVFLFLFLFCVGVVSVCFFAQSKYFSMQDAIPSTFRSHSGSVDNLDVIEVVRR